MYLVDLLPDGVKFDLLRYRGVRLFNKVLKDRELAISLEQIVFQTFQPSCSAIYLESLSRFFCFMKVSCPLSSL